MKENKRTNRQSRAAHLWFELLAESLNDAGLSMLKTLKAEAEIPWTAITIKEILFRQLMKTMLHKESTTQLTTKELTLVSETLIRYLGEKHNLETNFPSLETLILEQRTKLN